MTEEGFLSVIWAWMRERKRRIGFLALATLSLFVLLWLASGLVAEHPDSTGVVGLPVPTVTSVWENFSSPAPMEEATKPPEVTTVPTAGATPTLGPNVSKAVIDVISCDQGEGPCKIPVWQSYERETVAGWVEAGAEVYVVGCYHPVIWEEGTGDVEGVGPALLTPSLYTAEGQWCDIYAEEDGEVTVKGTVPYRSLRFEEVVG